MTDADALNQFDFWIGEWDLTWEGGQGTNRIEKILDSKVILENFDGTPATPLRGMSVSTFSREKDAWAQTWVDTDGSYLDFVGGWQGDRMVLSRDGVVKGEAVKQRMVWFNIAADAFDWHWDRSVDGGQTWSTQWAIHYRRRSGAASSE